MISNEIERPHGVFPSTSDETQKQMYCVLLSKTWGIKLVSSFCSILQQIIEKTQGIRALGKSVPIIIRILGEKKLPGGGGGGGGI